MKIFVGADISKGYADIQVINETGEDVWHKRYDDTRTGHQEVAERLAQLGKTMPTAAITFGLEATGGLERNWLQFFKNLAWDGEKKVFRLNPLTVKRFANLKLHRSITDKASARTIAEYLRIGIRTNEIPYQKEPNGLRGISRLIRKFIKHNSQLRAQLQSILPSSHPDLVAYCRDTLPKWVLNLLQHFPTAAHLARAKVAAVDKIPYVTADRATQLITAARQSVASVTDDDSAMMLVILANKILTEEEEIDQLQKNVFLRLEKDEDFQRLARIKSIGPWTAAVLRLEIGDFHRFYSADALTAFCGLDPSVKESGDSTTTIGISKEGNSGIRAVLFTSVLSGLNDNPPISEFYYRLRNRGKNHFEAMTACMRKLLHICYACVITRQEFDPARPGRDRTNWEQKKAILQEMSKNTPPEVINLAAPISRREAQRRKAAAQSQQGRCPDARDHAAATKKDSKEKGKRQELFHPGPEDHGCQDKGLPMEKRVDNTNDPRDEGSISSQSLTATGEEDPTKERKIRLLSLRIKPQKNEEKKLKRA
jgi:transposase